MQTLELRNNDADSLQGKFQPSDLVYAPGKFCALYQVTVSLKGVAFEGLPSSAFT